MNFLNRKSAPKQASPPPSPLIEPPPASEPLPPPDAPANLSEDTPTTVPPTGDPQKKSRFPRFKNPLSRKSNSSSQKSHDTSLSAALSATHISEPTPDQIARRAERRAKRQRLHDEWEEKNHQLRKEAVALNRTFVPLPEPPHINSESESGDEKEHEPEAVALPQDVHAPQIYDAQPMGTSNATERFQHESAEGVIDQGPYLPARPDVSEGHHSGAHMATPAGAHMATPAGAHLATPAGAHMATPAGAQIAASHGIAGMPGPAGPPRDLMAEAQMAEMYGRQAYTGVSGGMVPGSGSVAGYSGRSGQGGIGRPPAGEDFMGHGAPQAPTPVGWGDSYGGISSQPVHGNSMSHANPAADIDYALSEKIRRGRELGKLAVAQEEQGNLGVAQSGYIKALELLVPARRELDVGSEATKNARMNMKKKVEREAAAMLDRVEELKMFLTAHGPAVPHEMPGIPDVVPPPQTRGGGSHHRGRSGGGERGAGQIVHEEIDWQRRRAPPDLGHLPAVQPKETQQSTGNASTGSLPPPPPPPPFFDDDKLRGL
eukprot:GFKZ01002852.1.p1 GENE.GFKZ01002852.1~~GFKZ01002852.1.p1  ORF type:complete len:544 (-),score=84.51 GFKZ01002852.1:308-1939(-)